MGYCSFLAWNTTEIEEVFGEGYLPDDAMELTLPQNADITVKEFVAALGIEGESDLSIISTTEDSRFAEAALGIEGETDSSISIPIRLAGVALGLLFFMMLVERGLVRKRE